MEGDVFWESPCTISLLNGVDAEKLVLMNFVGREMSESGLPLSAFRP